jgi:hypothetical protein
VPTDVFLCQILVPSQSTRTVAGLILGLEIIAMVRITVYKTSIVILSCLHRSQSSVNRLEYFESRTRYEIGSLKKVHRWEAL